MVCLDRLGREPGQLVHLAGGGSGLGSQVPERAAVCLVADDLGCLGGAGVCLRAARAISMAAWLRM